MIRDAINAGDIPGPRYLANGKEIARRDGDLVPGITAYADGADEMRKVIKHHVDLGVDQIKLSMSGEEVITSPSYLHGRGVDLCYRSPKLDQLRTAILPTKRQLLVSTKHMLMDVAFVLMPGLEIRSQCV